MIKKFTCDKCGDLDYVLVDGYGFGDKILEDVNFEVRIENGEFKVVLAPGQDAYCDQLNMKYWLEQAHGYVAQHDFAECPKCRGDVDLGEPYDPKTTPLRTTTPAKACTINEFVKKGFNSIEEKK